MVLDGTAPQDIRFTHVGNSWLGNVMVTPTASAFTSNSALFKGNLDLDGFLHHRVGNLTVQGTLFFGGSLRNDAFMAIGGCVKEGGAFSGTGNNPCP
jgi:hypothetical protein